MQYNFLNKFLQFFLAIALIKFVLLLISASRMESSEIAASIVILMLASLIFFVVFSSLKSSGTSQGYSGGGGKVLVEESLFDKLRRKYESLSEKYRTEGQYLKASNIQLRLLQNPYRAAAILEEGGLYNEAAVLYLKKMENKHNAAQCYEKGKNYKKAIDLYKDLDNKEKTGDLYMLLNDTKTAHQWYGMLIDDYSTGKQYVKASLVARQKMQHEEKARELLLKGWESNSDAFNCINNYFASFSQHEALKKAISDIHATSGKQQKETLLNALKYEFNKGREMEEFTRDIAYEIIADHIQRKPAIASEMKHFNPADKMIVRDIIRYKAAVNKITANYVPDNTTTK